MVSTKKKYIYIYIYLRVIGLTILSYLFVLSSQHLFTKQCSTSMHQLCSLLFLFSGACGSLDCTRMLKAFLPLGVDRKNQLPSGPT